MQTPNIYVNNYIEKKVPTDLRETTLDLLYITDRTPTPSHKSEKYSSGRSDSMAYGEAKIGFKDKSLNWAGLLTASNKQNRSTDLFYELPKVKELGRYPESPYQFKPTANGNKIDESVLRQKTLHEKQFSNLIRKRLKQSAKKDVVLFVHGFNNTFNESLYTLTGIWHFLQRQGVPIAYSWPASDGGLKGYFTDRESGEFTIFHLKETFRLLSKIPEIENIHIIAHSRGTDVVATTLRELIIESRGKGESPKQVYRISNLILAAPDLDYGVIKQRLMAEQFGSAFGKITIYTSPGDTALGISQWLMNSLRFGKLRVGDIGLNEVAIFRAIGNVSLIKVPKSRGFIGHDYFHSNPAVSSDLINLILHEASPGSEKRPLKNIDNNFWALDNQYLKKSN